jgi:His/Glu/Gln/Arg/opine family amino acid ABC transporter permease subunit
MTLASDLFAVPWSTYRAALFEAAIVTIELTVVGFALACAGGLLIAVMRRSRLRALRILGATYTEVVKNIPLVTTIFIVYFGMASIGIKFDTFTAGVVSLTVFYSAYLSEVFRGGLQGVPHGQSEAASALGLRSGVTFWKVIAPQAVRLALPGSTTMLVDLLKGTSLLVTIGGAELMTEGSLIVSDTFQALEVYVVIGLIYLAMCWPLSQLALWLERTLNRGTPLSYRRRRVRRLIAELDNEVPRRSDVPVAS